ncbi:MAG: PDZ domain-containing protein, partial [Bacteroidaceae bacterium]|nr:PDZ domain-containing protein [Bacteroidaceae bacterium]
MTKVVDDLKNFGTVQRAMLGIQYTEVSNHIAMQHEKGIDVDLGTVNGLYVNQVTADGAAAAAGIKSGDVIIKIDGKKIEKSGQLQEAIAAHRPGDDVKITYLRDKKEYSVTVTLRNEQGTTTVLKTVDEDKLGVALEELSAKDKQALSLSYGLVVKHIKAGKMQKAGITKGLILLQVNDKQLRTVEDWNEAVKEANMSTDRVLWIRAKTQSGLNRSFTIELADEEK